MLRMHVIAEVNQKRSVAKYCDECILHAVPKRAKIFRPTEQPQEKDANDSFFLCWQLDHY